MKVKVKVLESNHAEYQIEKTVKSSRTGIWPNSPRQILTMSYTDYVEWDDDLKGKKAIKIEDHGEGVMVKHCAAEGGRPYKTYLDYDDAYELYIILSYYFKNDRSDYSEFEFIKEEEVFPDKEKQKEALINLMRGDANFYE